MSDQESWRIDRKVPLPALLTIGSIVVGIIWWGSSIDGRLDSLEARLTVVVGDHDRIVRIEGQLEAVRDDILELKLLLRGRAALSTTPPAIP